MRDKYFNFVDVLGFGWHVMKANLAFFIGLGFIFMVVVQIPNLVRLFLTVLRLPPIPRAPAQFLRIILSLGINMILKIGMIKIALSFCNERKPKLATLFDAWDCFWRYLGAALLYALIVVGGFLLLIVPGIIWAIQFSLYRYFVIDKGLGPIEALKASSRTTRGAKLELFALEFICCGIILLGLLCLVVGLYIAVPIVIVVKALVYRQLAAQTPELDEFQMTTTQIQPNPNWNSPSNDQEF